MPRHASTSRIVRLFGFINESKKSSKPHKMTPIATLSYILRVSK